MASSEQCKGPSPVSWDTSSSTADHPEPWIPPCSSRSVVTTVSTHSRPFLKQAIRARADKTVHVGSCVTIQRPFFLCSCVSAQLVSCDRKLRDQCKGTPCNRYSWDKIWNIETHNNGEGFQLLYVVLIHRYECPAGCLDTAGKVIGTVYYEMVSTQIEFVVIQDVPVHDIDRYVNKKPA